MWMDLSWLGPVFELRVRSVLPLSDLAATQLEWS